MNSSGGASSVSPPKNSERIDQVVGNRISSKSRKKLLKKFDSDEDETKLYFAQRRLSFSHSDEEGDEVNTPTNPTKSKISPGTKELRTARKRKLECHLDNISTKIPSTKNSPVKIKLKLKLTGNQKISIVKQPNFQDSEVDKKKKVSSLPVTVGEQKSSSKCHEVEEIIELSPEKKEKNALSSSQHQIRSSNPRKRPNSDFVVDRAPETKKTKEECYLNAPKNPVSETAVRKHEEITQPHQFFTYESFGGNGREFFGVTEDETLILVEDSLEVGSNGRDGIYFPMDGPYMCEICRTFVKTNREFVEHVKTSHDQNEIDETVLDILENQLNNETSSFITLE